jgi:hypothetical protein
MQLSEPSVVREGLPVANDFPAICQRDETVLGRHTPVTIHEHDSLRSDDADRTSVQALVDRLNAGEPYAVAFGGQGNSAWLSNLEELVTMAGIESELATVVGEAELLLEPVADELVVVRPIGFEPLRWVRQIAAEEPAPSTRHLTSAAVSLPGVLLSQIAAIRALYRQGLDFTVAPPVAASWARRRVTRRSRSAMTGALAESNIRPVAAQPAERAAVRRRPRAAAAMCRP